MGWGCGGKGGKLAGKGAGKPASRHQDLQEVQLPGENEELIWNAVTEAVTPILKMERELDQSKLEKRIRDSFRKAAKNLSFTGRPWQEVIEEFADQAFSTLFSSLGEKEWLPQCDFLLVLDAAIKDSFPRQVLRGVPQIEFEKVVLQAHDRAHEEQRIQPVMWDIVQNFVEGPKGKKKVYNALEESWKEAKVAQDAQSFVMAWVEGTIGRIAEQSQGEPAWVLEDHLACRVFDSLLQNGCMPGAIVEMYGPPPPRWPFIEQAVWGAYSNFAQPSYGKARPKRNKRKARPYAAGDEAGEEADELAGLE